VFNIEVTGDVYGSFSVSCVDHQVFLVLDAEVTVFCSNYVSLIFIIAYFIVLQSCAESKIIVTSDLSGYGLKW